MSRIEAVETQVSGVLDLGKTPVKNFPAFVEELIRKGVGFPIFQRKPKIASEEPSDREIPIIAYSGLDSVARMADPERKIKGVFAIYGHNLIYDPKGLNPVNYRDSYRWDFPTHHYYIDNGFEDVVIDFTDAGYKIYLSNDHFDFERDQFTLGRELTYDEVVKINS